MNGGNERGQRMYVALHVALPYTRETLTRYVHFSGSELVR